MPEDVQVQSETDVSQLVRRVQEGAIYGGFQAMSSLGKVGEPAIPPLMALLTSGDHNARWRSAMALARVGMFSVDPLIEAATTGNESVRNAAVWALAEIGNDRAVDPLITMMRQEPSDCCRAMTAAALYKLGTPGAIAAAHQECERSGEEFRCLVREAYWGT